MKTKMRIGTFLSLTSKYRLDEERNLNRLHGALFVQLRTVVRRYGELRALVRFSEIIAINRFLLVYMGC